MSRDKNVHRDRLRDGQILEAPGKYHENLTIIIILKELVVAVDNIHEKDREMEITKRGKLKC